MVENEEKNLITPGGVFISHVHEDEALAEAFSVLVTDVTGGAVPTFRSSSKEIGEGIHYGEEWFRWICTNVERARHIVAIITSSSTGRPWILFEAGLGKAKPDGSVFGLAIGIPREEAYQGPFAALQNCGTEEKELIKLCKELVAGTSANPRGEAIERFVADFRQKIVGLTTSNKPAKEKKEDTTSTAVFQALEDMKLMLRDQSRMFESGIPRLSRTRRPLKHTIHMIHELAMDIPTPEMRLVLYRGVAEELSVPVLSSIIDYVLYGNIAHPAVAGRLFEGVRRYLEEREVRGGPDYNMFYAELCYMVEQETMATMEFRMTNSRHGACDTFSNEIAKTKRLDSRRASENAES